MYVIERYPEPISPFGVYKKVTSSSSTSQSGVLPDFAKASRSKNSPTGQKSSHSTSSLPYQSIGNGKYILLKTIGRGEFAKVKLALHRDTRERFAIKLYPKENLISPSRKPRINCEIEILKKLSHPNCMSLVEVLETQTMIGLVLKYAAKGELFQYLLENGRLREAEAGFLYRQLIDGVEYIHSLGIAHRDLKLENLLLDENGNLLISDFGFSAVVSDKRTPRRRFSTLGVILGMGREKQSSSTNEIFLKTSCGSPCYAAPEIVLGSSYEGMKADLWSCGVILFGMLAGYLPFADDPTNVDGENIQQLYRYITKSTGSLKFPPWISEEAKSLISGLCTIQLDARMTLSDVRQHPWFIKHAGIGALSSLSSIPASSFASKSPLSFRNNRGMHKASLPLERVRELLPPRRVSTSTAAASLPTTIFSTQPIKTNELTKNSTLPLISDNGSISKSTIVNYFQHKYHPMQHLLKLLLGLVGRRYRKQSKVKNRIKSKEEDICKAGISSVAKSQRILYLHASIDEFLPKLVSLFNLQAIQLVSTKLHDLNHPNSFSHGSHHKHSNNSNFNYNYYKQKNPKLSCPTWKCLLAFTQTLFTLRILEDPKRHLSILQFTFSKGSLLDWHENLTLLLSRLQSFVL